MPHLTMVRHGLSEANRDNIVAGHLDSPLTDEGREQAKQAAGLIKDLTFDFACTSTLSRTKETLQVMLQELGLSLEPSHEDCLRERYWGDVEGAVIGSRGNGSYTEEEVSRWFTWNGRPRGGESYEDMHRRVVPYYRSVISPLLLEGKNVLMVVHNGMSKPLQRLLEQVDYDKAHTLNLKNCEAKIYHFDLSGELIRVEQRCHP